MDGRDSQKEMAKEEVMEGGREGGWMDGRQGWMDGWQGRRNAKRE